jgi:hypothetical protein
MSALLTLQLPVMGRVLALVTLSDLDTIRQFCEAVHRAYAEKERLPVDESEAVVYRAELERLRRVFVLIDPTRMMEASDAE